MLRKTIRVALAAGILAAAAAGGSREARADGPLFYNMYMPSTVGGPPAQMYLSPRPVPPHVGHTYYTYQPLYPHEFLYPHMRVYRRYSSSRWVPDNVTHVSWW